MWGFFLFSELSSSEIEKYRVEQRREGQYVKRTQKYYNRSFKLQLVGLAEQGDLSKPSCPQVS